jgi:hypothetical protein
MIPRYGPHPGRAPWQRAQIPTKVEVTAVVNTVSEMATRRWRALYLTPEYAPALSVTSDAALLFYGGRSPAGAVEHPPAPVAAQTS